MDWDGKSQVVLDNGAGHVGPAIYVPDFQGAVDESRRPLGTITSWILTNLLGNAPSYNSELWLGRHMIWVKDVTGT